MANPQIGTVPCPVVACAESCTVRRFAQRAATDTARRKAGKLYADCPTHGRFGFDGAAAMQDYILENGDIWGSEHDEAPGGPRSTSAPAPAAAKPEAPAPAAPKPAPASTPAAKPEPKKTGGVFEGW